MELTVNNKRLSFLNEDMALLWEGGSVVHNIIIIGVIIFLAQPAGAQGAMNKFKAMEPAGAGGAKPKYVSFTSPKKKQIPLKSF